MNIECYKLNNVIICLDTFAYNVINLTTREVKRWLTAEEFMNILEQVKKGQELKVSEIEKHRYVPRTYYRIYRVYLDIYRYKYFMEEFDGTSASYKYYFCGKKKRCLEIMMKNEEFNEMMY